MSRPLQIALISTDYPPMRTSTAVLVRDLAEQFAALGHRIVVFAPVPDGQQPWKIEESGGVEVLRLAAPRVRVESNARRAIAEMRLPLTLLRNFRKSPLASTEWDLVVWFSPPIFYRPFISALDRLSKGRARKYMILRDIFPEWAVDLGILKKGPVYFTFRAIAIAHYAIADAIGVQSESNLGYLPKWIRASSRRIEVLHNWLTATPNIGCSISVEKTSLAGRKIFVYTGNMGIAQGMEIFIDLVESLRHRKDIGFIFVGRGTEYAKLVADCTARSLDNVLFFPEIDSTEIPGLLAQCHVGLVALHPDHRTHNIPGKFPSYLRYGLPVLARVSVGTDLAKLIEEAGVGRAYTGDSVDVLKRLAEELADHDALHKEMSERGVELARTMFSPETAAKQIVSLAE
jgi:glycosyltransferase involved in cell wall biosynthesis